MPLSEYGSIIRARLGLFLIVVTALVAFAAAMSAALTPIYESRALIYFSSPAPDDEAKLARGRTFAESLVQSFAESATQPRILEPVIDQLGLPMTVADLADAVQVQAPLGTVILEVRVSDPSPQQAAAIANALAARISGSVNDLAPARQATAEGVRVRQVLSAAVPAQPTLPRPGLNLALALTLGSLAAAVICIGVEALDPLARTERAAAAGAGVPALGVLPRPTGRRSRLLTRLRSRLLSRWRSGPDSVTVARFEPLYQQVRQVCGTGIPQTVLFVGPRETTSSGRALDVLGALYQRDALTVVGVDAALTATSGAGSGGGSGAAQPPGLTSVLLGSSTLDQALWVTDQGLPYLPAGPAVVDPSALVSSQAMRELLDTLLDRFDVVLLRGGPALRTADGLALGSLVGSVILVADTRFSRMRDLIEGARSLRLAGAALRGVLLSG